MDREIPSEAKREILDFIINTKEASAPLADDEFTAEEVQKYYENTYRQDIHHGRVKRILRKLEVAGLIENVGRRINSRGKMVIAYKMTEKGKEEIGRRICSQ